MRLDERNDVSRRKPNIKKRAKMTCAKSRHFSFSTIDFPINCSSNRGMEGRKSDLLSPKEVSAMASLSLGANHDVPDSWMERDIEESSGDEPEVPTCLMSGTGTLNDNQKPAGDKNVEFPSEIWILLSDYILPNYVGKFAQICKTTYNIVSSQAFWRRMYKKHYDPLNHCDLPLRFQPDCMFRPRGLRAAVIRMLHLTHPSFLEAQSRLSSVWPDPHSLRGNICILQSSNRVGRSAYHYFKLKTNELNLKLANDVMENVVDDEEDCLGEERRTKALVSQLSDIHDNPEAGCSVLQVHAAHRASVAPVMGLKLVSASLSVSHGMRLHKLKLVFGSPEMSPSRSAGQTNSTEIVIDSVAGVKIYSWWHPHYYFEKVDRKSQLHNDRFFDGNHQ